MVWNLNPVAFSIFGLDIRWYGLVYVFGFFVCLYWGYFFAKKFKLKISFEKYETLLFGMFFAGILGARIGEFVFFSPQILENDWLEIFRIWNGGLAIQGGLIGVLLFLFFSAKNGKYKIWETTDSLVIPLAFVLIFGRFANFINGELYGVPTHSDWGIIFPQVDNVLRHPSQLYEVCKNFAIFLILFNLYKKGYGKISGFLTASFLFFYGGLRFGVEFFRDNTAEVFNLSAGQYLSIAMIGFAFCISSAYRILFQKFLKNLTQEWKKFRKRSS